MKVTLSKFYHFLKNEQGLAIGIGLWIAIVSASFDAIIKQLFWLDMGILVFVVSCSLGCLFYTAIIYSGYRQNKPALVTKIH